MSLLYHGNIMEISWKCNGPVQVSSNRAKSRKLYIEDMVVARKSVGKKPSWLAFHWRANVKDLWSNPQLLQI
jgi:hypothetical protein